MANFSFNVAKGRIVELVRNVVGNTPANSGLVIVAINTTASDAVLKDYDTLSQVLGDVNTAEVTNTNYARIVLTDVDLVNPVVDDGNDWVDADIPDQLFTSIQSGDSWTDLLICYDPDTTSGDDTTVLPLTCHDFVVSPNGLNIPVEVDPAGFYRAP